MKLRRNGLACGVLLLSLVSQAFGTPPQTSTDQAGDNSSTPSGPGADPGAGPAAPEENELAEHPAPSLPLAEAASSEPSDTVMARTKYPSRVPHKRSVLCLSADSIDENDLPPVWLNHSGATEANVGESYVYEPEARSPEGRQITYRVVKKPEGAQVEWHLHTYHLCDDPERTLIQELRPRIIWTPTTSQHGAETMQVVATDGNLSTLHTHSLEVRDDWHGFFLPGISYSFYLPRGADQGLYHGPAFELVLGGWINKNEDHGPSHGRVYASIGYLESTAGTDAVSAALGFSLSVERNPTRSFLIPYFGLETGGIFRQNAVSVAQFTPSLGIYIWSGRNVFLNVSGGYLFPTARIDDLLGYTARASLNLALW